MNSDSTQTAGTRSTDLNSAIDAVAREMTEGEPSGALRARVLDRIEQRGRRSSPALPRWTWAGAAAGVALFVAAAVWVARPAQAPRDPQATAAEQRPAGPLLALPGAEGPAVQPAATSVRAASLEGMSAPLARASRAVAAQGGLAAGALDAVPALAAIEPLRLASVEPAPLHVADMEISPITEMPAIEIPSLDQGSHDSPSADPKKEK
jgi:hypothetical protein